MSHTRAEKLALLALRRSVQECLICPQQQILVLDQVQTQLNEKETWLVFQMLGDLGQEAFELEPVDACVALGSKVINQCLQNTQVVRLHYFELHL
jgi:hypothetical protein